MNYQPHIFGHLYMAVFSNGTVKAGMSARDPQGRVTCHAHAGKAFGISMDASFFAAIYTPDFKVREKEMHAAIGQFAERTTGREWFKFASASDALIFAASYLHKVERMSFAERPANSDARLMAAERAANVVQGAERIFKAISSAQKEQQDIADAQALLESLPPHIVILLAGKVVDLESMYADISDNGESGVPAVEAAIVENYFRLFSDDRLKDGVEFADVERGISVRNLRAARSVLSSAMSCPMFFQEALTPKREKNDEVPA